MHTHTRLRLDAFASIVKSGVGSLCSYHGQTRVHSLRIFVLVFGDEERTSIAAWTSGEARKAVVNGMTLPLTSRPIYLAARE